jgi:hypothetical protein
MPSLELLGLHQLTITRMIVVLRAVGRNCAFCEVDATEYHVAGKLQAVQRIDRGTAKALGNAHLPTSLRCLMRLVIFSLVPHVAMVR